MIELEYTEKEEYPNDSALKRILSLKACNFTFYVSYPEGDRSLPPVLKGVTTPKKSEGFIPAISPEEFLNFWFSKYPTTAEKETIMENFKSNSRMFNYFFKNNPTIKYVEYELYLKGQQKKDDKQFKNEATEDDIGSIKDFLENKNYLYLHFINKERTVYEIMLLDNPGTSTYNILGQSSEKEITSYILNSLLSSQSEDVKNWFKELLRISFGKFKSKKSLVEAIAELLLAMPQYHVDKLENVSNCPFTHNYNYLDLDKFRINSIKEAKPTPSWDEFTALFRDENQTKLFMAWVWSVFEEKNTGRQWLWIRGPGNDGKSRVIKVITQYLDNVFGIGKMFCSADSDSHKNTFFYSTIHSKRIIVFGDNKDTLLMKNSTYQRITGGDHAPIEGKYKQAYAGNVYAKVLIASNYFPYIDFWQDSEVTRAIVLSLNEKACKHSKATRKNEETYEARLYAEFEDFLKKCSVYYKECKKEGSNDFIVPDSVMNMMKATCASEETNIIQYFMHTSLDFDPSYKTRTVSLIEKFEMFCEDSIPLRQLEAYKNILKSALGKEKGCAITLLRSPSGITAQYMLGCKIKDYAPKSYASVLRDEDATEVEKFVEVGQEVSWG